MEPLTLEVYVKGKQKIIYKFVIFSQNTNELYQSI